MYAIIETGGKQLKVAVGEKIYVERLPGNVDDTVTFDQVLLIQDDKLLVGKPHIKGASVAAKIVKQGLGRKLKVFKYKAKHNVRKMIGHRQPYTCLIVEAINH